MTETACKVCGIRYGDATAWAPTDWRYRTCPSCREWARESGYPVIQIDFETIEDRMVAYSIDQAGNRSTPVFRASEEAAQLLVQSYRAAHSDIADVFDMPAYGPRELWETQDFTDEPPVDDWRRPDYVPDWAEAEGRYRKD